MKKMVVLFSFFYGFLVSGLLAHFFMLIVVSSFPTDFSHFEKKIPIPCATLRYSDLIHLG